MFRNNRFGGLLAALFVLAVLAIVSFAAFQMGAASGAGADFTRPYGMHPGYAGHGFMFFPFFWGFGLLKLFFWLILISVFVRVLLRIAGVRGSHWGHSSEARMKRWQEMHDRWHTETDHPDPNAEPPTAQ